MSRLADRILARVLRGLLARRALLQADPFFAWLRYAGYPPPGVPGALIIHDVPADRQRFMLAVLWALEKALGGPRP